MHRNSTKNLLAVIKPYQSGVAVDREPDMQSRAASRRRIPSRSEMHISTANQASVAVEVFELRGASLGFGRQNPLRPNFGCQTCKTGPRWTEPCARSTILLRLGILI
jgi:hypothetical protein